MFPADSRFVWYNQHGKGRNRFASFRRTFVLSEVTAPAVIHLFADTTYQLFVNGAFVQFGPVRFDRRFPQFDSIDLGKYLSVGENVVAVLVTSFGCKTFKDNSIQGGFVAWGEIGDGAGGFIDLGTGPNSSWKARRCRAYDANAVKLSFALDPIDIIDQSLAEEGWLEKEFDDTAWASAVELEGQTVWGSFTPRSIPFMQLTEVPYEVDRPVDPLSGEEAIYSFSVPAAGFHGRDDVFSGRGTIAVGVATWIHSPRQQEVAAGLFWGRYFVNGDEIEVGQDSDRMRREIVLQLKAGWNSFFAIEPVQDDCFSFLFAVPAAAELTLSPRRKMGDALRFARTGLVDPVRLESSLRVGVPRAFDRSFDDVGGWQEVDGEQTERNPGRRSLWDNYSKSFESIAAAQLKDGWTFPISRYPNGFSIRIDFGTTALVIPRFAITGAAGAQVDLCYSEHLTEDRSHLGQDVVYCAGDRLLPSEPRARFLSSQPRGARYVRVTVRGASEDVLIERLSFLSCLYPVGLRGRFRCSDPTLNKVWAMCERTQRSNMEDVIVDCPGRERGMYLRDTIIQFHNILAAYGDVRLMARCMELFGQSPDDTGKFRCVYPNTGSYTIADFSLEAIDGYWQYYLNSGDLGRLESDWPAMRRSIAWFNKLSDEREDGLLDADWPLFHNVTAAYGGLHGDNNVCESRLDRSGPNANLTFPYLSMLRSAACVARVIGRDSEGYAFDLRRERVTRTARAAFWDAQTQRFNDNLTGQTQSFHASLLAVVAGVPDESQTRAIRDRMVDEFNDVFVNGYSPKDGVHFSPAYSFFIFQGLYLLGLASVAESLIRKGWGWMLAQGAVTTPEFFGFRFSQCHAWSASPMYYLSKYGLGVRFPKAPDFRVVEIDILSDLQWAEGAFPLPGSDDVVEVSWRRNKEGAIEGEVRAPRDVVVNWGTARFALRRLKERDPDAAYAGSEECK